MAVDTTFYSDDIGCAHCAMTIEKALSEVAGISSVKVDVASKAIRVQADSDEAVEAAKALLPSVGYAVRD